MTLPGLLGLVLVAGAAAGHAEPASLHHPRPQWRATAVAAGDFSAQGAPDWLAVSKAGATEGEPRPPPRRDAQGRVLLMTPMLFLDDHSTGRSFIRSAPLYFGESLDTAMDRVCGSLTDLLTHQGEVLATALCSQW